MVEQLRPNDVEATGHITPTIKERDGCEHITVQFPFFIPYILGSPTWE